MVRKVRIIKKFIIYGVNIPGFSQWEQYIIDNYHEGKLYYCRIRVPFPIAFEYDVYFYDENVWVEFFMKFSNDVVIEKLD